MPRFGADSTLFADSWAFVRYDLHSTVTVYVAPLLTYTPLPRLFVDTFDLFRFYATPLPDSFRMRYTFALPSTLPSRYDFRWIVRCCHRTTLDLPVPTALPRFDSTTVRPVP